jgi:hypothetical protein
VLQRRFPTLYRAARLSAPAGARSAKKKAPIFLALAFSDLVQIFSEGFLAILRMYLPAG